MRKSIVFPILLLFLAVPGAFAQKQALQSGVLPLDDLRLFPEEDLSVEINLDSFLLGMVSESLKVEDPSLASLLGNLRQIRVQVLPLKDGSTPRVKSGIDRAVRWLEGQGWKSTMRIRREGEQTHIYLKESDGKVTGMTVLAMNLEEAVVVNIVGRFNPADIGRISRGLDLDVDLPEVEKAPSQDNKKKPE